MSKVDDEPSPSGLTMPTNDFGMKVEKVETGGQDLTVELEKVCQDIIIALQGEGQARDQGFAGRLAALEKKVEDLDDFIWRCAFAEDKRMDKFMDNQKAWAVEQATLQQHRHEAQQEELEAHWYLLEKVLTRNAIKRAASAKVEKASLRRSQANTNSSRVE